jgi:hypothetical protein
LFEVLALCGLVGFQLVPTSETSPEKTADHNKAKLVNIACYTFNVIVSVQKGRAFSSQFYLEETSLVDVDQPSGIQAPAPPITRSDTSAHSFPIAAIGEILLRSSIISGASVIVTHIHF